MKEDSDDELVIEFDDEIDVDVATREALDAVSRVEGEARAGQAQAADEREGAASGTETTAGLPPGANPTDSGPQVLAWREEALRARADYENLKRRTEKEREENKKYLLAGTFRDLLPIVDNLGRALAANGSIADLKLGVELIHRQLLDLLRLYGVRAIETVGRPFDPSLHEAVARVETADVTAPTVSDELQAGFTIGDRLLRPALVKVAMPTTTTDATEPSRSGQTEFQP